MQQTSRNVEMKARCADLARVRTIVVQIGARPAGLLIQSDTYFRVPNGRLKLREIEGDSVELIWYDRPDQSEARVCRYQRVPVADAQKMKAALAAALGVRGEVRKRRDVYLWQNVRIHLDEVAGLGTFVELEAVMSPSVQEAEGHARLDYLCQKLSITESDIVPCSNIDLLAQ